MERATGCLVPVNAWAEINFARRVALEPLATDQVVPHTAALSGRVGFAFALEPLPGSNQLIGHGDGSGTPGNDGHSAGSGHRPDDDLNDANRAIGAAYWALLSASGGAIAA